MTDPVQPPEREAPGIAFAYRPASPDAERLRDELVGRVTRWEWEQGGRKRARSREAHEVFEETVGRLLVDLIRSVTPEGPRPLPCPKDAGAFTFLPVTYRPFKAAYDALCALRLIEVVTRGSYQDFARHLPRDDKDAGGRWGMGTRERIRVTQRFVDLMIAHGIEPGTWRDHRELDRQPPRPIELRAARTRQGRYKGKGKSLDASHAPTALKAEIEEINAFIREVDIEGTDLNGFTRIFSEGDHPDFDWDRGGRLYSNPRQGSYQELPKEERIQLRIIGEPVVEIDIVASQLTIAHGLRGEWLFELKEGPWEDPYTIDDLPRSLVKTFITATFGKGGPPRQWSAEQRERLTEEGIDPKAFSVKVVRPKILRRYPLLRNLDGLGWATLQFVESRILIETMLTLIREHRVPALPVHDSLIVPRSGLKHALPLLGAVFNEIAKHPPVHIRCEPPLKPGESLAA